MKMKKWVPEVPRPNGYDNELIHEFLLKWIRNHYPCFTYSTDAEIKGSGLFEDLSDTLYMGDTDEIANYLIKFCNWMYAEAKEIEEYTLVYSFDDFIEGKEAEWVENNGYTPPFKIGDKVQWHYYEINTGVIVDHYQLTDGRPTGKFIIQRTDKEEDGKPIVRWEDVELID